MRVLVTGASGLVGQAVVRELLSRGYRISTLHRSQASAAFASLEHIQADVKSPEAWHAASAAEAVIHLAGPGDVLESWRAPHHYLAEIVGGTLNVLRGAVVTKATFVIASSQRVYRLARRPLRETDHPLPSDPYAMAKLAAEGYCRLYAERYGLATRAVRLFSVYGPGQRGHGNSGVVAIFAERALAGEELVVEAGPRRDLTYVDDAARGLCLSLERAWAGFRIYNVATGSGTPLQVLAEAIVRQFGSGSRIVPPSKTWRGGDLVADVRRAQLELGYEPEVSLEEGLRRLLAAD